MHIITTTAEVLVVVNEGSFAVVRSLTNMSAAVSNTFEINYMLKL